MLPGCSKNWPKLFAAIKDGVMKLGWRAWDGHLEAGSGLGCSSRHTQGAGGGGELSAPAP